MYNTIIVCKIFSPHNSWKDLSINWFYKTLFSPFWETLLEWQLISLCFKTLHWVGGRRSMLLLPAPRISVISVAGTGANLLVWSWIAARPSRHRTNGDGHAASTVISAFSAETTPRFEGGLFGKGDWTGRQGDRRQGQICWLRQRSWVQGPRCWIRSSRPRRLRWYSQWTETFHVVGV